MVTALKSCNAILSAFGAKKRIENVISIIKATNKRTKWGGGELKEKKSFKENMKIQWKREDILKVWLSECEAYYTRLQSHPHACFTSPSLFNSNRLLPVMCVQRIGNSNGSSVTDKLWK